MEKRSSKMLGFSEKWAIFAQNRVKMVEKVIVSLDPERKKVELFGSAVEAARAVGVSKQAISYAITTGGRCAGRKWKRSATFFVVRSGKILAVCQKDGNVYLDMGAARAFKGKDVDKAVDVTAVMWEATL